jgi:hypothetical protein
MLMAGEWLQDQQNTITFVLIDNVGVEQSGLGATFNLFISKNGGAFAASTGTKSEIGNGWYRYVSTAAEADTRGPVSIYVTGAGVVQQNLEYVVGGRNAGCVSFTYTLTDGVNPVSQAEVWITTDAAGANILWRGFTDAFGVAYDANDNLPCLDVGTYYFWVQRVGFTPDAYPDIEIVS